MTLELPLYVTIPRKKSKGKRISLNLNEYRNMKYFTLNIAKKLYRDIVWDAFIIANRQGVTLNPPFRLTYTIYAPNKRRFDVSNVASVADKWACDALVELGLMDDDDYLHVPVVVYQFGGVDKGNPRCELTIEELSHD